MKIAIIGAGNMGQALVKGFIRGKIHEPEEIRVFDIDTDKAKGIAFEIGAIHVSNIEAALEDVDSVLLAVKPQVMKEAGASLVPYINDNTLIISIAAGITVDRLRKYLGGFAGAIARVMPNTPALLGQGASGICFSGTDREQEDYCLELLNSCGIAVTVTEDKMDIVTGVSGSGPAYAIMFADAMAKAGERLGLSYKDALLLSAQTMKGAAALIMETDISPAELVQRVCSPGGTTIEAVKSLESNDFTKIVGEAVEAAARRSGELSRGE